MSDTTFIYALKDPTSGAIRYIGKADDLALRFRLHLSGSKREKNHKAYWIMSLLAKGLKPVLEIIDEVSIEEWQAAEAAYIIFFKEQGAELTNITPGGEGFGGGEFHPSFGKPKSPEWFAKMEGRNKGEKNPYFGKRHSDNIRAKMRGRKVSAETRAKMSALSKGKKKGPPSPETRAKLSAAAKERIISPETRAKMGRKGDAHWLFGKHLSSETRARLSAAKKGQGQGRRLSPEICAKISAGNMGKIMSPEARAKISAATQGRGKGQPWTPARRNATNQRRERKWVEQCLAVMWQ